MQQEPVRFVEKPWGWERWIAVTGSYALKEIFFRKGERCSLQLHRKKEEHILILSGLLEVQEEDSQHKLLTRTYGPGTILYNPPGYRHRNTALEDTRIIEVSTPELDDLVRLEDDYQR